MLNMKSTTVEKNMHSSNIWCYDLTYYKIQCMLIVRVPPISEFSVS